MQAWVDLCNVKADRPGLIEPATCNSQVQRPTAEPPRNWVEAVQNSAYIVHDDQSVNF